MALITTGQHRAGKPSPRLRPHLHEIITAMPEQLLGTRSGWNNCDHCGVLLNSNEPVIKRPVFRAGHGAKCLAGYRYRHLVCRDERS